MTLIALQFWQQRLLEAHNRGLALAVAELHGALSSIDDPQRATSILQAFDRSNQSRFREEHADVTVFFQVWDGRDGRVVFGPLRDLRLGDLEAGYSKRSIAGRPYYIYFQSYERWGIAVGQARVSASWLLKRLNDDITMYVLIAFPIVLFPGWLALRVGLRPLRDLARDIGNRTPDDLAPVEITGQHAELNLLADAFNQQLARVRRLIAREREFVQDAAHELRTPMAVIAVNAHAVANARTAEERAAAEARLHSGLSRTSHLIEQLLVLARLDVAGRSDMALRDVVSLVKDDLARAGPSAVTKDIELSLEAPDSLNAPVEIHTLSSIVGNLVENALRYGHNGGRVAVILEANKEGWSLRVEDDGIGIPVADRARVFERFYRGDHYEVPGTGLGLAIVQTAAARLGGTVSVGDGLGGRGCGFKVQFSRARVRELPAAAAATVVPALEAFVESH